MKNTSWMKNNNWIRPISIGAVLAAGTVAGGASERPNVLLILTDDMRYDLMTNEGHPYIQTPNLDRLAAEGMRFTQAYSTTPLCGPSRMSILSGRQASAHGRLDNFYYPESYDVYFPENFHDQGYRTAMIGKYYEGSVVEKKVQKNVYDFWFKNGEPDMSLCPAPKGSKEYREYRNSRIYYDQPYEIGDEVKIVKGHQTDILFDQAKTFSVQKPDQPFLIWMCPFAPHAPFNPTLRRLGKYTGKGVWMKDNIEFGVGYMVPTRVTQMTGVYERNCEMVEDIDEGVGNILQALEKSGQLDNTIIIFTSDNGVMFGEHGFGWKRHPWQESVKVPLLIRYPKVIQPGSVCDAAVTLADLFPTCAELTGVKLPDDPLRYGKSLVPLLSGDAKQIRSSTLLMEYEKGVQGQYDVRPEHLDWVSLVREDGWKLIRYREGPPDEMHSDCGNTLLFNLKADPLEMQNLAGNPEKKELIKQMKKEMLRQLKENNANAEWL